MACQEIPCILWNTTVYYRIQAFTFPNSAAFRSYPFDFVKTHFNITPQMSGSSKQANSLMFTIANALRISCVRAWNRESLLRASRLWEELWSVMGILRSQCVLPVSVESPLDDRNVAHTYPNLYVYETVKLPQPWSVGVHTRTFYYNVTVHMST